MAHCDHSLLKATGAAFDAGTRPVVRGGQVARQFGARLHDCVRCTSTLMHPDDAALVDAYLDAQETRS